MSTDTVMFALRKIGKGAVTITLAICSAGFAAYALRHFPFWGFALSFLLMVGAFVPLILFYNLFMSPGRAILKGYQVELFEDNTRCDLFPRDRDDDLFDNSAISQAFARGRLSQQTTQTGRAHLVESSPIQCTHRGECSRSHT